MIIYKATNKTTKKEYVGLTKNELSNRKADHKRKEKSGKRKTCGGFKWEFFEK